MGTVSKPFVELCEWGRELCMMMVRPLGTCDRNDTHRVSGFYRDDRRST